MKGMRLSWQYLTKFILGPPAYLGPNGSKPVSRCRR